MGDDLEAGRPHIKWRFLGEMLLQELKSHIYGASETTQRDVQLSSMCCALPEDREERLGRLRRSESADTAFAAKYRPRQ